MKRILLGLAVAGLLSACAASMGTDASPEKVASVAFREGGQKTLTVMTMVNNRTGSGGHTALMVKGSQTVIFDPAGSFRDERIVERGDVIYGVSPKWLNAYRSAHARSTYHVVSQEIPVSAAQAEQALRLVMTNGAVPGAYCANSTSTLMGKVDGFEGLQTTFYPVKFMEQIAKIPGVKTTKLFEDDNGDKVNIGTALAASQTE